MHLYSIYSHFQYLMIITVQIDFFFLHIFEILDKKTFIKKNLTISDIIYR